MAVITDKATTEEKAQAWDHVMQSTKPDTDEALYDAWTWLADTVREREQKTDCD